MYVCVCAASSDRWFRFFKKVENVEVLDTLIQSTQTHSFDSQVLFLSETKKDHAGTNKDDEGADCLNTILEPTNLDLKWAHRTSSKFSKTCPFTRNGKVLSSTFTIWAFTSTLHNKPIPLPGYHISTSAAANLFENFCKKT